MTAARTPDPQDVATAAARLTGSPAEMAVRLRALIDAEPPKAVRGETGDQAADRQRAAARRDLDIEAYRHRLAADFAEARGWRATVAPIAVKELAARSAGGNWHRPPREWLATMYGPAFYRDAERRSAAMVAHPIAQVVETDRAGIEAWATERGLIATFPDFPSWRDPGNSVLAVFEPASPATAAAARALPDLGKAPPAALAQAKAAPAPRPMRPVAPIDLDGAAPADLAGTDAPSWDLVAPTELLVDEAYQRELSPKSLALIRRIATGWSWSKFKPPVVARVDGALHVLDGQHTAIGAATHGGVPLIPVLVVPAAEVADHAAAFVSHATSHLPTTITQVHHAAVQAGDPDAITIDRVCRAAGVDLVAFPPPRSAYRPRQTIALNAIRRLVDRRGAMRARQILEPLAAADLTPISADHIRAAEALLCDPDLSGEVDAERITAGMRALAAKGYAEAKTYAATRNITLWRAMVAIILRGKKARPKAGRLADGAPQPDGAEPEEAAA